ncbi:hypothetical protein ARMSODRAFT_983853 [Armillaria solidipes]|uniref:Uncharacterized protein n=1 Tax=Armillaria solidipes TaxID=1076256 RepID=A0A2H3AL09_9AGAR|nr:hypothetical protein ARMSODRAFT_983853 [Armillaria solidipes]
MPELYTNREMPGLYTNCEMSELYTNYEHELILGSKQICKVNSDKAENMTTCRLETLISGQVDRDTHKGTHCLAGVVPISPHKDPTEERLIVMARPMEMQLGYLKPDIPLFVVMVGESEGQWAIDEARMLSIRTRNDKGLGGHFERVAERALVPEEQHYKRTIPWEGVTLELYTIGTFDSYLQQRFKGESKWERIEHMDTWEPFECGGRWSECDDKIK